MKKLVIPLFIPLKNSEVDYDSLKNIINSIEDSIILIGNYNLNNLSNLDYINVYLFLKITNLSNEYYLEKIQCDDCIINSFDYDSNKHYVSRLGNIFSNEIKELLLNQELGVNDKSLNSFINVFNHLIKVNTKEKIEYILIKEKLIIREEYSEIINLLGINDL